MEKYVPQQSKYIDGERAIRKEMRIQGRIDGIKKLGEAGRPAYGDDMKKNLPLIRMKVISLISIDVIETQGQAKHT
jgi:hypothetical protein